ncbi:MAG TPA: ABC transporter ATP-binding protein [Myxococcales bacterium]|jgi:ABC-2 type transport system ATP-binding protein
MNGSAPAIVARGLGRRFGERTAVDGLTFEVEQGEIFGMLGPNGAGKTTTLRMLCGLLAPSAGDAEICGLTLSRQARDIRRVVGLLTEQPGLYDRLTARENLVYFARLYGVDGAEISARLARLFATLGLTGREDDRVGGFSKGMRQKVAIARALVHDPKVVFLDEPTSGLDPEASANVRGIVEELASQGRTIVLCTHNLDEAARLCRRVAVVKGRVLALGAPAELARSAPTVEIQIEGDAAPLLQALADSGLSATAEDSVLRVALAEESEVPALVARLVGLGARIRKVQPHRELEDTYLRLVAGGR